MADELPAAAAGFVFRGTVAGRGDADLGPSAAGRTLTVRVDEVLHGTDVLRGVVGRTVVVVTERAGKLAAGDDHVFFTNCVSLGDPVVAVEIERRPASADALDRIRSSLRATVEQPLAARAGAASMIVTGRVASSSPVAGARPRSEHDPDWWVARVEVDEVLKGPASRRRVDVLYANSEDIAWYRSPKLHEGVSGTFLLHTRSDSAPREGVPSGAYEATDPLDLQPDERLLDVRRLLDDGPGGPSDG